jgi:hypothetical protein
MLAECGTDENGRDIGTHRQEVIDELWNALMVQTRQCFQNIEPGRFPKVVYFCGLTVLNSKPAIAGQTL